MELQAFVLVVMAIGLETFGQTSFKLGTSSIVADSERQTAAEYLRLVLGSSWVRVGILAYVLEILCAVSALALAPLSVVFPLLSLSYCGVAVAGWVFLGETLPTRSKAAIVLITTGAAMISWSSRW